MSIARPRGSSAEAPASPGTAFVSIGGLSRATGVPIETLRTWESRYGFPASIRKPSGHRQFDLASVGRIRRIAGAIERGLRAGDVVPASDDVLNALLATVPERPAPRPVATPLDARAFIDSLRRFDADRLTRTLHSELVKRDPIAYLESRILPCLEVLGRAWEAGEIEIAHEHFASERISDVLRHARLHFEETANGPLVVLATLPGEEHGLGLQMAALVLSAHGLRVLNLGTEVPAAQIATLTVSTGAIAVGLSVSSSTAAKCRPALQHLREGLPRRLDLLLGGVGAPADIRGTRLFRDFRTLDNWAEAANRPAARAASRG